MWTGVPESHCVAVRDRVRLADSPLRRADGAAVIDIDELLKAERLPSLPHVVARLLRRGRDPEPPTRALARGQAINALVSEVISGGSGRTFSDAARRTISALSPGDRVTASASTAISWLNVSIRSVAAAGTAAYMPTDGTTTPDYMTLSGGLERGRPRLGRRRGPHRARDRSRRDSVRAVLRTGTRCRR